MWLTTDRGREIVIGFSREVVREVAPAEMPIFDEMAREYIATPEPPDLKMESGDDPIGFGSDSFLAAATPAAMAMAVAVLTHVLGEGLRKLESLSRAAILDWIRQALRPESSALSEKQLEHVGKLAFDVALKYGIPRDQARVMTDALFIALMKDQD